jgi:hypothetical protein
MNFLKEQKQHFPKHLKELNVKEIATANSSKDK